MKMALAPRELAIERANSQLTTNTVGQPSHDLQLQALKLLKTVSSERERDHVCFACYRPYKHNIIIHINSIIMAIGSTGLVPRLVYRLTAQRRHLDRAQHSDLSS